MLPDWLPPQNGRSPMTAMGQVASFGRLPTSYGSKRPETDIAEVESMAAKPPFKARGKLAFP
jgi:hypothetical protein